MNLDKAIEILTDILTYVKPSDPPEEHDALKLGIKAMKAIKKYRPYDDSFSFPLLPGETES